MSVSSEQRVSEEAIVRVLRATRANDAEAAPKKHPRQTPQCPSIARFAAVLRRKAGSDEKWTPSEDSHHRGCAFCMSLFRLFNAAADAASAAGDLTVSGLDTGEETQTGVSLPGAKKSGTAPKPSPRRTGE